MKLGAKEEGGPSVQKVKVTEALQQGLTQLTAWIQERKFTVNESSESITSTIAQLFIVISYSQELFTKIELAMSTFIQKQIEVIEPQGMKLAFQNYRFNYIAYGPNLQIRRRQKRIQPS